MPSVMGKQWVSNAIKEEVAIICKAICYVNLEK
jgi:hypothetical protein